MNDREKIVNAFVICRVNEGCSTHCPYWDNSASVKECTQKLATDVYSLLKEQEEREKAICKGICEFIRGSCSTDTYSDKEYVCHVVQQMFIKEGL